MAGESAAQSVAVEAFGVTVAVTADPQHFAAVRDFLPPGARPVSHPPELGCFALVRDTDDALLRVVCDEQSISGPVDLRLALGILDAELRMYIALNAPDPCFRPRGSCWGRGARNRCSWEELRGEDHARGRARAGGR